ncbi:hypothetical protein [Citrobacter amalonaticus]|uniref:hypothetical protein n=1 Tax=Citrobacter amalonaticus TaxID=35703 RepID=UPI00300C9B7E
MKSNNLNINNISTPVVFYVEPNGTGESFSTTQNIENLSGTGFENKFSSVLLPPQTKVIMYSEANFSGKTLTIGNGSSSSLLIDFSETIGAFPSNIHTDFSWGGINMNDQCYSFELFENINELCGCSFYEFKLQYDGYGNEPVVLYDHQFGDTYLTYFYADDPNFGPEHNDRTSSLLVLGNEYAYLYEDNYYAGGVKAFEGTGIIDIARIYNIDGDVSWLDNRASAIKVGTK